jgi:hypothetical protein
MRQWLFVIYLWFRGGQPEDPYVGVRVPLRKGPGDLGAGVALK